MFLKNRNVNSAGGVSNTSPNVGQYGWTKTESSYYNQLLQYVESARTYAESAKLDTNYIKGRLEEIDKALKYFETLYNKIYPLANQIDSMYRRILEIRAEVDSNHKNIITLEQAVRDMYETIEVYYNDIVIRSDKVGEEAIEVRLLKATTETLRNECQNLVDDLRNGQVYRGTWNPKTDAYPNHEGTNSVWDVILDDGVTDQSFDGKTWRNGDRLIYVLSSNQYQRLATGSGVTSVNGLVGAVTITPASIKAVPSSGNASIGGNLQVTGNLTVQGSETNLANLSVSGTLLEQGHRVYSSGNKPTVNDISGAVDEGQLTNIINEMKNALFPIGYVYVSFGTANPATLGYPGTWVQLDADSSLSSSASPSTAVTGTNTPTVPVPAHDHAVWVDAANTDHTHAVAGDTQIAGNHSHSYVYQAKIGGKLYFDYDGTDADVRQVDGVTAEAGNHSHSISLQSAGMNSNQSHTHTGGTAKVGTEGATLDVRGKRYAVTMWRRSA